MARKYVRDFLLTGRRVIRTRFTQRLLREAKEARDEVADEIEEDIRNHPISKELSDHTYPSQFFDNPRGTLFGFMGFETYREPIDDLVNYLKDDQIGLRLDLEKTTVRKIFGIFGYLRSPDSKAMAAKPELRLKWGDGRSWPEILEDSGISGLSYFFSIFDYGRSQEGFQTKHLLRDLKDLGPQKFLGPIFKKAEKSFKRKLQTKVTRR